MTERDFVYWLQGFLEVANPTTIDATQTQIIKDHLALVLKKETPTYVSPTMVSPSPYTFLSGVLPPDMSGISRDLICSARYDISNPRSIYDVPRGKGIMSC